MRVTQEQYIWSDTDVCVLTTKHSSTISDIHDIHHSIATWTCPQSRSFTGPVCRLDDQTYIGLVDQHDLLIWSMTSDTATVKYSSSVPIVSYDLHPQYLAVLEEGRTGRLVQLCRQTLEVISEHTFSDSSISSISVSLDRCHIALLIFRSDHHLIQFFNIISKEYVSESLSLQRAAIMIQYLSDSELLIMHTDMISIWSIPYQSCIWSSSSLHTFACQFSYLQPSRSIAMLMPSNSIELLSIPDLSSGLASALGTGPATRALSSHTLTYDPTPDTPAEYLQAIRCRAAHSSFDIIKYHSQISQCIAMKEFCLVQDLIQCSPEHTPRGLFPQLLHLDQHDILQSLLSITNIEENDIVQMLNVIDPDRHGLALLSALLALPKTDSVIVRHLAGLTGDRIADLFVMMVKLLLLESSPDVNQECIVNWICLLFDSHPMDFIHHPRCCHLLEEWEPIIQSMAQTCLLADNLISLVMSYQRQNTLSLSRSDLRPDFMTDKIETISSAITEIQIVLLLLLQY